MKSDVKREFARMVGARKRLVEVRSERMEQLLAVRALFRAQLADFFETLDPITNMRLAEVSADGSKSHGDLSIALKFFEGTELRLAVDVHGRFSHRCTVPSAFDDVERVVEIRVSGDLSRAEVAYEPIGSEPGTFRSLDLVACTMHLLEHAIRNVEAELPHLPERPAEPVAEARVAGAGGSTAVARVAASLGGLPSRPASPVRPMSAVVRPAQVPAAAPPPNGDVLTLRLG